MSQPSEVINLPARSWNGWVQHCFDSKTPLITEVWVLGDLAGLDTLLGKQVEGRKLSSDA